MLSDYASKKIHLLGKRNNSPSLLNQVADSLLKCESMLYEHDEIGVVITKPTYHDGKLGMLIWVAIGFGVNVVEKYLPLFEKAAKETGMAFIMFETKRKGFSRFIKKFNFTEHRPRGDFFVFIKEV
jgi:hypothetical protein